MKVVILAGGLGTRISEESHLKPKPMIEIGEQPILWHIMKIYSHFGINDFIICAGYKQHIIKEYFADYYLRRSDVTFDFSNGGEPTIHASSSEPWRVTIVDTGLNTMTGGRVKRIKPYIGNETFMLSYGDGLADVDISTLREFHVAHGKTATLSGVNYSQRFGILDVASDGTVSSFREKSVSDNSLINGGYMVLEPSVFDYIPGDEAAFESTVLERLASEGELVARHHPGFWRCMDTQNDRSQLEALWASGKAPWKLW